MEGRGADWMRKMLGEFNDFKGEKNMIERMLLEKGHIPCFLPKFHTELNPIESSSDTLEHTASIRSHHCARTFHLHTTR